MAAVRPASPEVKGHDKYTAQWYSNIQGSIVLVGTPNEMIEYVLDSSIARWGQFLIYERTPNNGLGACLSIIDTSAESRIAFKSKVRNEINAYFKLRVPCSS
jgi:hypothetical protein